MGQFPENHAVDFNHTVKAVVEAVPHTVDSPLIRFLLGRFQKAGAEGRCQGKGGEGGKNDGNRNSQGKLLIQDTGTNTAASTTATPITGLCTFCMASTVAAFGSRLL